MRIKKGIKKLPNRSEGSMPNSSEDIYPGGESNPTERERGAASTGGNAASNKRSSSGIDIEWILTELTDCPDIIRKKVYIDGTHEGYFFHVDNFVDRNLMERDFILPILAMSFEELKQKTCLDNLPCVEIKIIQDTETVLQSVLAGSGVFVCAGLPHAVGCVQLEMVQRAIEEPVSEKNIRGSHEGFIEILQINLSILRRRIKNEKLKFKMLTLGRQTNQNVAVAYIEGIVNMEIVNSLIRKIEDIQIDGLTCIGALEQIISAHPHSIFPQYLATERPYKVVTSLLEGRIAIFLEGTPVVLIAPVTFSAFFQALDDYSTSWIHGSFLRLVRIISMVLAILLPSMYIAITNFHYYVVPLDLLIPLSEAREKVPFPPIVEVLFLEALVEIIREASVRLPTYVGIAVGVFASIVVGQASIEASLVSSVLIVIVGSAAVSSFATPSFDMSMAIRILRFAYTIAASFFGIIGIVVMANVTLTHLTSLESLGQPYFQPFAPFVPKDMKDTLLRLPTKAMQKRPAATKTANQYRGGNDAGK